MLFATEEWFAEWVRVANDDERFRAAGAGWQGTVGLVVRGGSRTTAADTYARLDGADGRWTALQVGTAPRLIEGASFELSADLIAWRAIVRQELDPLRALITGRVRVHGQLSAVLSRTTSLRVMTELAGGLDTTFPTGVGS